MDDLKKMREALDLTQAQLAEMAGTSQPQIKRLESGERELTRSWAERLAPHLRTTAMRIMFPDVLSPPASTQRVPLISTVSAGVMMRDDLVDEAIRTLAITDLPAGDWFALQVEGDSMDRISPPESIILVNRKDKRLVTNACYVIADQHGNATYKRYRPNPDRFEPVSTNPSHEPIFPDHEAPVVGRVRRTILDM